MDDAMFNDLTRSLEQAAAHARGETVPGLHVHVHVPARSTLRRSARRPISLRTCSPVESVSPSAPCGTGSRAGASPRGRRACCWRSWSATRASWRRPWGRRGDGVGDRLRSRRPCIARGSPAAALIALEVRPRLCMIGTANGSVETYGRAVAALRSIQLALPARTDPTAGDTSTPCPPTTAAGRWHRNAPDGPCGCAASRPPRCQAGYSTAAPPESDPRRARR